MIPRRSKALFVISVLAATLALPVAYASDEPREPDCMSVGWTNMVDQLRIIAHAGREIALGFGTDQPGEGFGAVLYVAPSVCTGLGGLPSIQNAAAPLVPEGPSYPALP